MRHLATLALCLSVCALALGSYVQDWERVGPADGVETLTFHIALHQRNVDKLEALLYSISDPNSPTYGRQATDQEVADLIHPPKEDHDAVFNFFANAYPNMIIESYGDALKIKARVSDISAAFSGNFFWYKHGPSGHRSIRADIYEGIVIPAAIASKVYMVTGLASFPIIMKQRKVQSIPDPRVITESEFGFLAPSTIRRIYNIPAGTEATNSKSSQCALEFNPEGAFSFSDYQIFCKEADEKFTNYTKIVGEWFEGSNTESELDVQILGALGTGAQNWYWTVTDGWIYEMALDIYNNETKPWVFSISYGWPELFTCGSTVVQSHCSAGENAQYISRANAELAKLGVKLISIITCSQDEGAPSDANLYCSNTTHPVFGIYPGSSPFVTSVSGTSAVPDNSKDHTPQPPICVGFPCTNSTTEQICMHTNTYFQWNTGGGFSDITTAPSYQAAVVKTYLSSKARRPPTEYFQAGNRGYPDISAIGARVLVINGGETAVAEGTSASTPIIAAIVTLLNDARFNANKSPLGFLNPVLYDLYAKNPKAFQDITVGSNQCTYGSTCCDYGYGAIAGWDAVSGLGTPNFQEILAYVMSLN